MGNQRISFDSLEWRGMTMAIKDLIRSSWKTHRVLGDVDQGEIGTGKGDIARLIHEASARSEIGAVAADCIAPGGTDAPLGQANLEDDIRLEERFRERARIAHESASTAPSSLEHAFSNLLGEVGTGRGLRLRVFVQGKPWTLNPAIQEQLFLIGREAIINALRHSQATKIEVEIQYQHDLLRACSFVTMAAELIPKPFKESAIRTGVFAECVSAQRTSARDLLFVAGQVRGQKCTAIPIDVAKRQPMDGAATDSPRKSAGSRAKRATAT